MKKKVMKVVMKKRHKRKKCVKPWLEGRKYLAFHETLLTEL